MNCQSHQTNNQNLTVKQHIPCLGILPRSHDATAPTKSIPSDLTIAVENSMIFHYLRSNCSKFFESTMENLHACTKWPEKGTTITLKCMLDLNNPAFQQIVKTWTCNVSAKVNEIIQCYQSNIINIAREAKEVYKVLQAFMMDESSKYSREDIAFDLKDTEFCMVGKQDLVQKLSIRCKKVKYHTYFAQDINSIQIISFLMQKSYTHNPGPICIK